MVKASIDLTGLRVLVTGGTRGLGKAVGQEFASVGAAVCLTHRWATTDDDELMRSFTDEGLAAPLIVESDVSDADAVASLMNDIGEVFGGLDAIVSNVAFAKVSDGVDQLSKNVLDISLGYSAWPVVSLFQAAKARFGKGPKYLLGVSSDGPNVCHPGYDYAGVCKATLETMCRYLAIRLKVEGVRVNAIRPGFLDTDSAEQTFGRDALESVRAKFPGIFLDPRHVARTCVALSSGLMDSVSGQVLVADEAWSLVSPITYLTGQASPGEFPSESS